MDSSQADSPPTREQILLAASRLFAENGFAGTSTRQITEVVGITQPALYRHFDSKASVLLALATEIVTPLAAIAGQHQHAVGSPTEQLASLVFELCTALASSPYDAAPLLGEHALVDPLFIGIEQLYRQVTDVLELIISDGIDSGEFRPIDPRLAQLAIMSLTDLLIFRTPGATDDKVQHIVDFAVRGVLADTAHWMV